MQNFNQTISKQTITRRDFARLMLAASALAVIEHSAVGQILAADIKSLTYLSAQTASGEGVWRNLRIEGKLPADLSGTLFRTAPGQTENHGTRLKHLFDGDAYLSAWQFENGAVELRARFLNTPQRTEEINAKTMLYSEFGTPAPPRAANLPKPKYAGKNQPSVNVVRWQNQLLGLSEGGLPTVINERTFAFEGRHDFQKTVSGNLTFTAHPRFCPESGDGFAWGFEKGNDYALHVFRLDAQTGKAETLYRVPQTGFYMAHDAMLTENYFLIVIPPMRYDIGALLMERAETIGEALRYYENEPARLLVFPRDNQGSAAQHLTIDMPAQLVFHHGNARETADGKIVFETVCGTDRRLLDTLANFKLDKFVAHEPQKLEQLTVDLNKRTVVSRVQIGADLEFPTFDHRLTGQNADFLVAVERDFEENACVVRFDLKRQTARRFYAGQNRTFGEAVFAPKTVGGSNENNGYLLVQGFDALRNETFLEIRDAATLDFAARVWAAGQHFPLGFHGNFYQS